MSATRGDQSSGSVASADACTGDAAGGGAVAGIEGRGALRVPGFPGGLDRPTSTIAVDASAAGAIALDRINPTPADAVRRYPNARRR
jgi:hypothetical protein